MKHKPATSRAHTLHQPIEELVTAKAMAPAKRRKAGNRHAKIPGGPSGPLR